MLAELIGVLKKIRTTAGAVGIVEPSTGSEPITKACASAAGGRNTIGNQLSTSNIQRLNAFEIVHQSPHARNISNSLKIHEESIRNSRYFSFICSRKPLTPLLPLK